MTRVVSIVVWAGYQYQLFFFFSVSRPIALLTSSSVVLEFKYWLKESCCILAHIMFTDQLSLQGNNYPSQLGSHSQETKSGFQFL